MAASQEPRSYREEIADLGSIEPYRLVQLEIDGAVATIAMNDPSTLNCFSLRLTVELRHALDAVDANERVRSVILTGCGPAFSAGGDVRRMRDSALPPAERYEYVRHEFGGVVNRIISTDKPVIAAVNGHAMGVGFFAALACDLVVASEAARFGTAYIKIGLTPLGVSYVLARTLGYARAYELCALGDVLDARRAEALGIVNRVVPADGLMAEATTLARRLADGPPRALGFTKQILRQAARSGLEEHMSLGEAVQPLCLASGDHREALDALAAKRRPAFSGL